MLNLNDEEELNRKVKEYVEGIFPNETPITSNIFNFTNIGKLYMQNKNPNEMQYIINTICNGLDNV